MDESANFLASYCCQVPVLAVSKELIAGTFSNRGNFETKRDTTKKTEIQLIDLLKM